MGPRRYADALSSVLITLASLIAIVPHAAGATAGPYTSTSDFDSGDKGLVSLPGSWDFETSYPTNFAPSGLGYTNGLLYLFGGFDSWVWTDAARTYNPSTDAYASLTAIPTGTQSDIAMTVWADRIYGFGGSRDDGAPGCCTIANLNLAWYYNVTAAAYTSVTALPSPLGGEGLMAVTYNAQIFVTNGSASNNVRRYFPGNDTYQDLGCALNMGLTAWHGVVSNFWYFVGGLSDTTLRVRRFNLATNACDNSFDDAFTGLLSGTAAGTQQASAISNRLYAVNGFRNTAPQEFYRRVWEYDPATGDWREMASSQIARTLHANGFVGNVMYGFGGVSDQQLFRGTAYVEAFDPTGTTYDGHSQVESSTDTSTVSAGEVRLATCTDDSFYRADDIGEPLCWDARQNSPWGSCITRNSAGNASLEMVRNFNDDNHGCVLQTSWSVDGNLDVQGEVTVWGNSQGFNAFQIQNVQSPWCPWSTGTCGDGVGTVEAAMFILRVGGNLEAYTVLNSAFTACGAAVPGRGNNEYVRIQRSSNSWSFYYGTDGTSWTLIATCSLTATGPWWISTFESGGLTGLGGVGLRDFYLSSGATLGAGSYRSSGSWTTPTTSLTNQRVTSITLGHSSLSATTYIDRVDLLVDDSIVWSYTTDITSGTTTTLAPDQPVDGSTKVRVTLAGPGTGSPVLESVSYDFEGIVAPPRPPPSAPGWTQILALECSAFAGKVSCTLWERIDLSPLGIEDVVWLVDGSTVQGWREGDRWRMTSMTYGLDAVNVTAHVAISNGYDRPVLRADVNPNLVLPIVFVVSTLIVLSGLRSWSRGRRR